MPRCLDEDGEVHLPVEGDDSTQPSTRRDSSPLPCKLRGGFQRGVAPWNRWASH